MLNNISNFDDLNLYKHIEFIKNGTTYVKEGNTYKTYQLSDLYLDNYTSSTKSLLNKTTTFNSTQIIETYETNDFKQLLQNEINASIDYIPRTIYILSKDILKHRRADKGEADVWLAKGGTWADENIQVTATGSNDSGVSWIVETEGKRIFHAGDLCNWYARFLADGNKDRQPYSEELGEDIDPVAEEKRFLGELKDIQKIAKGFELVMFPVDGRIGNGYTLGARQFIERFQVGMFVPMHFVQSGFESAWRMEPFCQEKHVPFWRIACEGDSIVLADGMSIRHTRVEDIPQLQALFSHARSFMLETGNPSQWTAAYPSEELLRKDIGSRDSYVVEDEKQTVIATFVLRGGVDPTYDVIYEGRWLNDAPYATIHRIASDGTRKGILNLAMQFALLNYNNIRIDTHRDNQVMRNAITKEGFVYCGVIHCWNGDERVAYQFRK